MTKHIEPERAEPAVPAEIAELFGQRHLVFGEKPELYDALSARIASAVHPEDIIEWFWVKDITDLLWEIQRLRGFKAAIINQSQKPALSALIQIIIDDGRHDVVQLSRQGKHLAHKLLSGKAEERKAFLEEGGFDEESVAAKAFSQKIEALETLDRLLTAVEFRRDKVLREIEFHRETLGRRMREAVKVEDSKPALLEGAKKDTGSSVHN